MKKKDYETNEINETDEIFHGVNVRDQPFLTKDNIIDNHEPYYFRLFSSVS